MEGIEINKLGQFYDGSQIFTIRHSEDIKELTKLPQGEIHQLPQGELHQLRSSVAVLRREVDDIESTPSLVILLERDTNKILSTFQPRNHA